jgi:hypothetical protein
MTHTAARVLISYCAGHVMGVDGGSMSARMIDSAHVALVIKNSGQYSTNRRHFCVLSCGMQHTPTVGST